MPILGYCSVCGKLVPIEAKGLKSPRARQQAWYPVKHPKPGDDTGGENCPGMKTPL
jgi:hypothetical protein